MKVDVIAAGEIFADLIMGGFDFWPLPGREAFAKEFRRDVGGGAAITACGLATLGNTAALFGIVGTDTHPWIAERLREKGVDTEMLETDSTEPGAFTVAVTSPGDRTFFTYPGANKRFPAALARVAAAKGFAGARHVHLAYAPPWDMAADVFDAIHQMSCTLSLDAGWHEDWLADPRALGFLRHVDVFLPNESEAARMTGETRPERILQRFADAGVPRVALKLGEDGSAMLHEGALLHAAPPRVSSVDTTGAGDCFDAGFLHAWLRGEAPGRCLAAGNICGALSTEAYGGIAGFPSRERLLKELGS